MQTERNHCLLDVQLVAHSERRRGQLGARRVQSRGEVQVGSRAARRTQDLFRVLFSLLEHVQGWSAGRARDKTQLRAILFVQN